MTDSILGKELTGKELLVLTDAGLKVAEIKRHAGKWAACDPPLAVFVGTIHRRPDLALLQLKGAGDAQVWHRSFWRVLEAPGE